MLGVIMMILLIALTSVVFITELTLPWEKNRKN